MYQVIVPEARHQELLAWARTYNIRIEFVESKKSIYGEERKYKLSSYNFDELYKKQGRFYELWEKQKL